MNEASKEPVVPSSVSSGSEPAKDPSKDQQAQNVSYESYLKAVDEAKKAKARAKELEQREREREEAEAKKRGDFEALLKTREEELERVKNEFGEVKARQTQARKLAAVLESIEGEVDPKWYGHIDLSSVVVHPETDQVDQMSVAKTVETIRKNWPEMIKNPKAPVLPADAPKGNGAGKITKEEWLKLSGKEMTKWKPDQIIGL